MTRYAHVGPVEVHPEIWRTLIRHHNGNFNAAAALLTKMLQAGTVQSIERRVKLIEGTTAQEAIEAAESLVLVEPKHPIATASESFAKAVRELGDAATTMNAIVKTHLQNRLPKP